MTGLASQGQLRASMIRWMLFTVPLIVLLGFLSGQSGGTDSLWYQTLQKPAINPPSAVFPIVWTALYVMMGVAVAIVCAAWGARGRTAALVAFAVHFVLNLAWTPVFFGAQELTGGLVVIVLMIITLIATIALFWKIRPLAGALLLPYLAWIVFAAVLNFQFLSQNPELDGGLPDTGVERVRLN